jgi:aminoglycoside phosphotransferase (APT) family kinase protein
VSCGFAEAAGAEFGVVPAEPGGRLESRSGAGVRRVRTRDGSPAYLKVTPATLGPGALAAADRELRFYLEIAPAAPIRTPHLIAARSDGDGIALLLEAAGERAPADAWTPRMWSALGHSLAALHEMPLPARAGWHRKDAPPEPDLATIEAFWRPSLPSLDRLLDARDDLEQAANALPPAFVHGDCHTDNIVLAAGVPVFCDWQSAHIGRPLADLAFLSVRATPAGVSVPAALLDAYLERRPLNRRAAKVALVAEELAVLVRQWPAYAGYNGAAGIARVRARALLLADRWFAATG